MNEEQRLQFKKDMLKSLSEILKIHGILTEDECKKIKTEFDKITN